MLARVSLDSDQWYSNKIHSNKGFSNFWNFWNTAHWTEQVVRDMRLVVMRNVFGTCLDKTDADPGTKIINIFLESC
jgi:hypothetical protein